MTKILKNAVVSFASVTKPEGHKNGKHLLGVYVDKAFKKQFEKDFNDVWEENKTSRAKKPAYDMNDWFSKDEKDSSKTIFWTTARADKERGIIFKQGVGCDFSEDDFEIMGTGSVIDLEYSVYYFNSNDYGEMVSRAIQAISLKELTPYEGGSEIEGEALGASKKKKKNKDNDKAFEDESEPLEEDEPKKKKKKKKKKKHAEDEE